MRLGSTELAVKLLGNWEAIQCRKAAGAERYERQKNGRDSGPPHSSHHLKNRALLVAPFHKAICLFNGNKGRHPSEKDGYKIEAQPTDKGDKCPSERSNCSGLNGALCAPQVAEKRHETNDRCAVDDEQGFEAIKAEILVYLTIHREFGMTPFMSLFRCHFHFPPLLAVSAGGGSGRDSAPNREWGLA